MWEEINETQRKLEGFTKNFDNRRVKEKSKTNKKQAKTNQKQTNKQTNKV